MKLITFIPLILLGFAQLNLAQDVVKTPKPNAMSNVFGITAEGGITLGSTDYTRTVMDYTGKASFEYYLPSTKLGNFGFRLFVQEAFISGKGVFPLIQKTDKFITKIDMCGGGVFYTLSIADKIYPWVGIGISNLWFYPEDGTGNKLPNYVTNKYDKSMLAYNGDAGVKIMVSKNISVNLSGGIVLGAKDYLDDIKVGSRNDEFVTITAGVSYYFGRLSDADGDGVPNANDVCPGTPKGIKVDEFGCPLDEDKDGVYDYLDDCPNTPIGLKVDATGCPVMKEHVSAKQAKIESLVLSGDTNFEFDESNLLPISYPSLDGLVITMKEHPEYTWEIGGYTDSIGADRYNEILSKQRAQSVADYLISKGVRSNNLKIVGYGKANPIATNETEDGRFKNRRVEIKLLSKGID